MTNEIEVSKREIEIGKLQVESRERALYNVIKEFQKFIYYVLRAEPKQAEYLLDVERLMIFELTKTVMETRPEMFQGNTKCVPFVKRIKKF